MKRVVACKSSSIYCLKSSHERIWKSFVYTWPSRSDYIVRTTMLPSLCLRCIPLKQPPSPPQVHLAHPISPLFPHPQPGPRYHSRPFYQWTCGICQTCFSKGSYGNVSGTECHKQYKVWPISGLFRWSRTCHIILTPIYMNLAHVFMAL